MSLILSACLFLYVARCRGIVLDVNIFLTRGVDTGNGTTFEVIATHISSNRSAWTHCHAQNTYTPQEDSTRQGTNMKTRPTPIPLQPSTHWSSRAKVAISIYSTIGLFIVIGTIYDIVGKTSQTQSNAKLVQRQSPSRNTQHRVSYNDVDETANGCPNGHIQEISRATCTSKCKYWRKILQSRLIKCFLKNKQKLVSFNFKKFTKRFLLCFSLYTNGQRLLNTSVGAGTLGAINGIRFLSITWVILGHTLEAIKGDSEIVRTRLLICFLKNKRKLVSFSVKNFTKRLLLCFSLYTNGQRLLNTSVGTGTLRAVNGIRFLSITWVIIGHTLSSCKSGSDNPNEMVRWVLQRWTYQPFENASPSVDSFFTLSGLLVSYLTLKELRRSGGKFNIFMYYFHRYFRLTAPMGMVMLFVLPLMQYFGHGPRWPTHRTYCENNWWKTILYLGNLDLDKKGLCMGGTWYMMNDMQFYFLSPLILLPLYFRPRLGIVIWSMFLITTLTATGIISRIHQLAAIGYEPGGPDRSKLIYTKPYTRMGPYLIGMAAGWILHRTNLKLKIKWYINALMWAAAVSTGLAVIYGLVESDQEKFRLTWDVASLYNATHRTAWGVALCWVVIAGATNNGGFVNTILSWEPFVFLSRCSFMAYLLHFYTNEWFFSSGVKKLHLTDIGTVFRCLGSVSIAFVVAAAATLVMEAPILNIETLIFKRERRK